MKNDVCFVSHNRQNRLPIGGQLPLFLLLLNRSFQAPHGGAFFCLKKLCPKDFGAQPGGNRWSPQELRQLSDWGDGGQPTPLRLER